MMLLGTLSLGQGSLPSLVGIEGRRVIVVSQDDLSRYSWPIEAVSMDGDLRALLLDSPEGTYRFTPDLTDRFRWVMTAAMQEASSRPSRRRWRRGLSVRGLAEKLVIEAEAA